MNYAEKLRQFNSTGKYNDELMFLSRLIGNDSDSILDYGAGLGTAVKYIESIHTNGLPWKTIKAIEPNDYYEGDVMDLRIEPKQRFDTIYFMHSIAHISNIMSVIEVLKYKLTNKGEVIVITPNKTFLDIASQVDYTPDPTVIRHYEMSQLIWLFASHGYKIKTCGKFGQEFHGEEPERLFLVAGL